MAVVEDILYFAHTCKLPLVCRKMLYTLIHFRWWWTGTNSQSFYLKSFDMDSVQVGKVVFGVEIHTTLGIEPSTILQSGVVRQSF